jgi:hypothetical protein
MLRALPLFASALLLSLSSAYAAPAAAPAKHSFFANCGRAYQIFAQRTPEAIPDYLEFPSLAGLRTKAKAGTTPTPGIVHLRTEEGWSRLGNTPYAAAYEKLRRHYRPQRSLTTCGEASACLAEAYLRAEGKISPEAEPFRLSFLRSRTGIPLGELVDKAREYFRPRAVTLRRADTSDEIALEAFRNELKRSGSPDGPLVFANFVGREMGLTTGAHHSPVVAFDPATDSALVMDVAAHKTDSFWVPVKDLWRAMHTKDGDLYRGYWTIEGP